MTAGTRTRRYCRVRAAAAGPAARQQPAQHPGRWGKCVHACHLDHRQTSALSGAGGLPACACLQDSRPEADRLLTHGEQLLQEWKSPDPIIREQHPREPAPCLQPQPHAQRQPPRWRAGTRSPKAHTLCQAAAGPPPACTAQSNTRGCPCSTPPRQPGQLGPVAHSPPPPPPLCSALLPGRHLVLTQPSHARERELSHLRARRCCRPPPAWAGVGSRCMPLPACHRPPPSPRRAAPKIRTMCDSPPPTPCRTADQDSDGLWTRGGVHPSLGHALGTWSAAGAGGSTSACSSPPGTNPAPPPGAPRSQLAPCCAL